MTEIALTTRQEEVIASAYKEVSWLFRVVDKNDNAYTISTKTLVAQEEFIAWDLDDDADMQWLGDEAWYNQELAYDYTFKVTDFRGIEMRKTGKESGIIAPNDLSFSIINKDHALTHTDFKGGTVWLSLSIDDGDSLGEEVIRRWRFRIKKTEAAYQKFKVTCEDFLQQYLRGSYPNTARVYDLFPSSGSSDDLDGVCIPVPFGTPFIPLRYVTVPASVSINTVEISFVSSVNGARCRIEDESSAGDLFADIRSGFYVSIEGSGTPSTNDGTFLVVAKDGSDLEFLETAGFVDESSSTFDSAGVTITQDQGFYLLGPATDSDDVTLTYTVSKVHEPRSIGNQEWTDESSGGVEFNQYTKADANGDNWRLLAPIIADANNDGIADSFGYWAPGDKVLDVPVKFSRNDTGSLTDFADLIEFVLLDMGLSAFDLNDETFAAAKVVYASRGLTCNGAFWFKRSRKEVLALLLNQCHSTLYIGERVELHPLSKTSQATIDRSNVLLNTFKPRDITTDMMDNSGYVLWQQEDEPQDAFIQTLIPACDSGPTTYISNLSLHVPFIHDSQDAQTAGILHLQRLLPREVDISFSSKLTLLRRKPEEVLTVNHADYGGTYDIIIETMFIVYAPKTLHINFKGVKLVDEVSLEDWEDVTPSVITVTDNNTQSAWRPVYGGPQSATDFGRSAYEVWGIPYLIVGPTDNLGAYLSIQSALNALEGTRHNEIRVLNGAYPAIPPVHVPDRGIKITGESEGGVILNNTPGSHLFVLHNLTEKFLFSNFTITSQNVAAFSNMIYIYGDTAPENTSEVKIYDVSINLTDDGLVWGDGDYGVYASKGNGSLLIENTDIKDGLSAVYGRYYDRIKHKGGLCLDQTNRAIDLEYCEDVLASGIDIFDFQGQGIYMAEATIANVLGNTLKSKNDSDATVLTTRGIYVSAWLGEVSNIIGNKVRIEHTRPDDLVSAISLNAAPDSVLASNTVYIDTSNSGSTLGIAVIDDDAEVNNNVVHLDNDDNTSDHAGLFIAGDRGLYQGNKIDMVNADATGRDIGILFASTADDNEGSDNLTINCSPGKGVVDRSL